MCKIKKKGSREQDFCSLKCIFDKRVQRTMFRLVQIDIKAMVKQMTTLLVHGENNTLSTGSSTLNKSFAILVFLKCMFTESYVLCQYVFMYCTVDT